MQNHLNGVPTNGGMGPQSSARSILSTHWQCWFAIALLGKTYYLFVGIPMSLDEIDERNVGLAAFE